MEVSLAVIPARIIDRYLNDVDHLPYRGFPSLGVRYQSLVSLELRRVLSAVKAVGVRVVEVAKNHSSAAYLLPDDIIIEMGGFSIDRQGYYHHPRWGDLPLPGILNGYEPGEKLSIKVIRQGKQLSFDIPLVRHDSNHALIAYQRYDQPEPHLIYGGFLFQELSREYLMT